MGGAQDGEGDLSQEKTLCGLWEALGVQVGSSDPDPAPALCLGSGGGRAQMQSRQPVGPVAGVGEDRASQLAESPCLVDVYSVQPRTGQAAASQGPGWCSQHGDRRAQGLTEGVGAAKLPPSLPSPLSSPSCPGDRKSVV